MAFPSGNMLEKLRKVPLYGWLTGIGHIATEYSLYLLAHVLSELIGTSSHAWCPKIPVIDDKIGVVAIFSVIYVYAYFFWFCGPVAVSLTGKRHYTNFAVGLFASYLVGFFTFLLAPSYMDRVAEGILPYADGNSLTAFLLRFVYYGDGGAMGRDMFPSFHCLISVYCYLGVRRQPAIKKWYRVYSLVMAILICLSTLLIKQHYVLDVVGGVGLALISYAIVQRIDPGKRFA